MAWIFIHQTYKGCHDFHYLFKVSLTYFVIHCDAKIGKLSNCLCIQGMCFSIFILVNFLLYIFFFFNLTINMEREKKLSIYLCLIIHVYGYILSFECVQGRLIICYGRKKTFCFCLCILKFDINIIYLKFIKTKICKNIEFIYGISLM